MTILLPAIFAFLPLQQQAEKQSDRHFWYSLETTASPDKIWSIWTDVPNWKDWDSGLKNATLNGSFELKSKGTILSLEDRTSKFQIVEFMDGQSYTFKTKLPLASLYVRRCLEVRGGRTVFTHEVWFEGIARGLFA
ncbi:MAG: SRPBCC family protein, partial [Bacteroidota bacterium]